ncbi:hypothetical protein LR48_Vigan05g060000 [Vigna angularis]|uniref:Ubiquitin-like protease family profile domain-containing protein n=1 Tax=Phaseolus angularis TaxID=3914 RepID=A0A0L9UJZ3_PHAAN|nr:hypothetical protein LR48_Vigan05g060000 [Vigna angularis]
MIMPYFGPPTLHVYRPKKQPIAQPVNEAREEAEDHDVISILTSRLNKLRKGQVEMPWELRTFGLECHVPLYINFDDAYEIIGGEKMLNISCIQLWCMYMDTIIVESGRASVYGFLEPQTIQPSGNTLDFRKSYIQTWMTESNRERYIAPYIDAMGHWQLMVIIPKKAQVVWFCSLHRKIKAELKSLIQTVVTRTRGQQLEIIYPKRPKKQPIAQPVNEAREEAEDHDVISILTSRLNKLRKGQVEMPWELRTFGLECHVPLYINFDDAYEIIGGEKMLNISCIQLWCMGHWQLMVIIPKKAQVVWFCSLHRKIKAELKSLIQTVVTRTRGQQLEIIYPKCNKQNDSWACGYYIMSWMKAIIRAEIRGEWTERFNTPSPCSTSVITTIREDWARYLNKHFK